MGVKRNKRLVVEFMSVLDRALAGPNGLSGKLSLSQIVKTSGRTISVKAVGEGSVSMSPRSGALSDGGSVKISAKPKRGSVFVGWWRPDGKACGWTPKMEVRGSMPGGCYEARFRRSDECRPPSVLHPPVTTLHIRVRDEFKHTIKVEEGCRPVSFRQNGKLPTGVKLDGASGVLSGKLWFRETNDVEVVVVGSDAASTKQTVKVSFVPLPPRSGAEASDDGDDHDDDKDDSEKKEDE